MLHTSRFLQLENKFELEIIGSKGLIQVESLPKWGMQKLFMGNEYSLVANLNYLKNF